jgi:cytochrome c biogenesis protein CcdA/DsbC/DsbD-like thiol-disulfide interchange protein
MYRALTVLLTLFLLPLALAQDPFGGGFSTDQETTATVTPEASSVEPGDYFQVAFTLDLKPHFHAYYKNAGILGDGPSVEWTLPDGLTTGELKFPIPTAIKSGVAGTPAIIYGYEGNITFIAEIQASDKLEAGSELTISGTFRWQECDDSSCVPGDLPFSFNVTTGETTFIPANEELFENASEALPQDGSAWGGLATEKDDKITLEVLYPEGTVIKEPVYFFSIDKQIDSQAAQSVEITEGKAILTLDRNRGNEDLYIDAGEVADTLSGLLTFQGEYGPGSIEINAALTTGAVGSSGGGSHLSAFVPATDADRKAGLEVYDVNARPEAVLLGGAKEKKVTFFSSLGLVFLGGLILNLMPCVFPVLGIKIMGFVAQAGEDEKKIKIHGMVFALGLLVTMWILAAVIISLKLDWGQQLANPVFLGTMIIIFFLMGLNLFGLFEIGTSMTSVGGELQSKKGYSGSFFSGALTTLVATPCSGPFLGAVMAFALSQESYAIQFTIFTVFALGIASPYIILSMFPALIKKLPRPGAWMETFKQVMAFFVFATAVFFMKGFLKLVGDDHFNIFLFALCLIGLGVYIYGRYGTPMIAKAKRLGVGYGLAGLMTIGGIGWAYSVAKPAKPGLAWHEWYPGIMELSRPKGRIIWLDYTADW